LEVIVPFIVKNHIMLFAEKINAAGKGGIRLSSFYTAYELKTH
jgi:hypothetical protein